MRWGHTCSDGTTALVRVGYDCAKCGEAWPQKKDPDQHKFAELPDHWAHRCRSGEIKQLRNGDICDKCGRIWNPQSYLTTGFEKMNLLQLKARAQLEKPHASISARAGDVLELCRRAGL